ncbi:hypothetical protein [Deinococcus yunweiensis]|uniref:hypothetical protein n=1 Tax=Deinococcus yunweiensis TaxID=367282 RepID=UPI00398E7DDB
MFTPLTTTNEQVGRAAKNVIHAFIIHPSYLKSSFHEKQISYLNSVFQENQISYLWPYGNLRHTDAGELVQTASASFSLPRAARGATGYPYCETSVALDLQNERGTLSVPNIIAIRKAIRPESVVYYRVELTLPANDRPHRPPPEID